MMLLTNMATKQTAKFRFDTNLLNASHSNELENAKKEWKFVLEEKRDTQDGLCICQRRVKKVIFMYNVKTKLTIMVGSTCHKKFNMSSNKINKFLSNMLNNSLLKGEYSLINNIIKYSNSVEEELIKSFQFEYEKIISSYMHDKQTNNRSMKEWDYIPKKLSKLLEDIQILIEDYELDYLQDLYIQIFTKMHEIYEEIKKYEESKIYKVKILYKKYTGQDSDYFIDCFYFISLELCEKYIEGCAKVGVTVGRDRERCEKYNEGCFKADLTSVVEDIKNIKIEILCKNKSIKKIGENYFLNNFKKYIPKEVLKNYDNL